MLSRRALLAAAAAVAAPTPARAQALDFTAASRYSAVRRGVSLLVMQRGALVFELYQGNGRAHRGWELASGTKSFCGVMAAAAIQDGLISGWDEPCAETLHEWREDERGAITLRQLLSLTSGLDPGPIAAPPPYAEAVASPAVAGAGQNFAYGPTPFQVFGEIMRRITSDDPLAYLTRRILAPLSIAPTHWRRGRDGNPHMPSGAGFTARDWARFGQFVLNGGEGLVDADALAACFEPSAANPGYGLTWWLLRDGSLSPLGAPQRIDPALLEASGPIHAAAGAGNQRLFIMPRHELVIVHQATGILRALRNPETNDWSDVTFLRTLLSA